MNVHKLAFIMLFKSVLILIPASGQETINTTGGNVKGAEGVLSYSVGQIFFNTLPSGSGYVSEGVQNAFEILTISNIDDKCIYIKIGILPDPIADLLYLRVENCESQLRYQLFDIDGKMLKTEIINEMMTQIEMYDLKQALYLMRVLKNNKIVKSFKILKNN